MYAPIVLYGLGALTTRNVHREGVWHAVSKWFGVDDEDIPNVLPNIGSFDTEKHIFQESDMFETG